MKPVEFKHQNIVFAKDQPEYQPLPALRIDSPTGEVVSCWRLSFKERIKVLVFARMLFVHFCKHNSVDVAQIAKLVKKHRTSIIYMLCKYCDEVKYNANFRRLHLHMSAVLNRTNTKPTRITS